MENAQWIKPLWPGDIPANTTPSWNTNEEKWEFIPIVQLPTSVNISNTANTTNTL